MIISDRHRFVFVHIPKCAGSSVRKKLSTHDDWNGFFTGVHQHDELGRVDFVHLPLFVLDDHFPEVLSRVRRYWSAAIVRNPFERFGSSLAQHLFRYGDEPLQNLSIRDVELEIRRVIDHLVQLPQKRYLLPPEYIYFQKQVDYLFLDKQLVVKSIYRMDDLDSLLGEIGRRLGGELDEVSERTAPHEKRSVIHRNEVLRRLLQISRPIHRIGRRALPERIITQLRAVLFVPRDERLGELFRAEHVREFISNYYQEDIALWERLHDQQGYAA